MSYILTCERTGCGGRGNFAAVFLTGYHKIICAECVKHYGQLVDVRIVQLDFREKYFLLDHPDAKIVIPNLERKLAFYGEYPIYQHTIQWRETIDAGRTPG
jgi:hypothetical protein